MKSKIISLLKILMLYLVLFSIYFFISLLPAYRIQSKPFSQGAHLRIAHRCSAREYPENTLRACQQVDKLALADILEIDVRMTADQELVVVHDEDLQRTTNGIGKIEKLTLKEIQKWDAGYHFSQNGKNYPFRGQGIRIEKVALYFQNLPRARFSLEIKTNHPQAGVLLAQLIEQYQMQDKIVIGSFHAAPLQAIKERLPFISYYANFWQALLWFFTRSFRVGVLYTGDFEVLTIPEGLYFSYFREQARREGRLLFVWTVNNTARMTDLIKMGVDGIITDRIHTLNRVYYQTSSR